MTSTPDPRSALPPDVDSSTASSRYRPNRGNTTDRSKSPLPLPTDSDVPPGRTIHTARAINSTHTAGMAHSRSQRGAAIAVNDSTRSHYRSKEWWSPTAGVRLPDHARDLGSRCDAVLLAVADAVISGVTAARLWELPIPESAADSIEITVPHAHAQIRRPGVRCRRRDVAPEWIRILDDRPVMAPARLFVDLAGELHRAWLVALGDAALRRGLLDEDSVIRVLAQSTGNRGVRFAREAFAALDPRAESPRESIMRVILADHGFVKLVPQFEVTDAHGAFLARVDVAMVEARIAIEYDGAHHLSVQQQGEDALRRQRLEMQGWMVVTVNSRDIHEPQRLVRRVRAALQSRYSPSRP